MQGCGWSLPLLVSILPQDINFSLLALIRQRQGVIGDDTCLQKFLQVVMRGQRHSYTLISTRIIILCAFHATPPWSFLASYLITDRTVPLRCHIAYIQLRSPFHIIVRLSATFSVPESILSVRTATILVLGLRISNEAGCHHILGREINLYTFFFCLFGRNHDGTIFTSRTIQCRSRSTLQNVYTGNILTGEIKHI